MPGKYHAASQPPPPFAPLTFSGKVLPPLQSPPEYARCWWKLDNFWCPWNIRLLIPLLFKINFGWPYYFSRYTCQFWDNFQTWHISDSQETKYSGFFGIIPTQLLIVPLAQSEMSVWTIKNIAALAIDQYLPSVSVKEQVSWGLEREYWF